MDISRIRKELLGLTRKQMLEHLYEFLPAAEPGKKPPKGPSEQRLWEWEGGRRAIPEWVLTAFAVILVRAWEAERQSISAQFMSSLKSSRLREANISFAALLDPALGELLAIEPLMEKKGFLKDADVSRQFKKLKTSVIEEVHNKYGILLNRSLTTVSLDS